MMFCPIFLFLKRPRRREDGDKPGKADQGHKKADQRLGPQNVQSGQGLRTDLPGAHIGHHRKAGVYHTDQGSVKLSKAELAGQHQIGRCKPENDFAVVVQQQENGAPVAPQVVVVSAQRGSMLVEQKDVDLVDDDLEHPQVGVKQNEIPEGIGIRKPNVNHGQERSQQVSQNPGVHKKVCRPPSGKQTKQLKKRHPPQNIKDLCPELHYKGAFFFVFTGRHRGESRLLK